MSGPQRDGGTLSISWGKWCGFYWNRGYCARLCLGWVAITYIPRDLDELLRQLSPRVAPGCHGELHIYSPDGWHDDAWIVGTAPALIALRAAIDKALDTGRAACLSFATDGEGFAAVVLRLSPEEMLPLVLPYLTAEEYRALLAETGHPGKAAP